MEYDGFGGDISMEATCLSRNSLVAGSQDSHTVSYLPTYCKLIGTGLLEMVAGRDPLLIGTRTGSLSSTAFRCSQILVQNR